MRQKKKLDTKHYTWTRNPNHHLVTVFNSCNRESHPFTEKGYTTIIISIILVIISLPGKLQVVEKK